jgi:hypothetical protein
MAKIYSTAKICAYENRSQCNLSLDPGKYSCETILLMCFFTQVLGFFQQQM